MSSIPTDTYLSFILSRPLQEVWSIFLLTLARIVPPIAIAPFLGGKALSDGMKMGFGVGMTFIFLPFIVVHAKDVPVGFDITFALLLIKEVFLGAVMGMLIAFPYYYTQSAGSLINHQMGADSLQVKDPMSDTQTAPTGTLMADMIVVIFFNIGGMLLFFEGMLTSFSLISITEFMPPSFYEMSQPLFLTFLDMANLTLKMTIQLSAPPLLAMLMADLFLGIANRMAPQVQITFLLYSLKSFTGIGVLAIAWWLLLKQLDIELLVWFKEFSKIIQSF